MSEFTNVILDFVSNEYVISGVIVVGLFGASVLAFKKLKKYSASFGGRYMWPMFPGGMTSTVREHEALMNKLFPEKQKTPKDCPNKEKTRK